ncbi:MAG: PilZ domain-containing protein [Phycisphaerales bacterium]|nr:PilZ domain-containing protein [Phycisphaerales bacterium]
MPANRSRTDRWRQSLQKIHQRGGGLEFAINRGDGQEGLKDLVWRVRVLDLSDDEIVIEQPGAMGQSFVINEGTELVGIMAVGQNKWMFETKVLGSTFNQTRQGTFPALRIAMPVKVVRCMRRHADRTSIAHINLPKVECWKLLDPMSAVPVEVANRIQVEELIAKGQTAPPSDDQMALPEVGPKFEARLANLGGGGVGLVVPQESRQGIDSGKVFWMRLDLRPSIPAPLVLTAKLVHSHIDSAQDTYAGMAFDFGINNQHKDFVIKQIARYISSMQVPVKKAA